MGGLDAVHADRVPRDQPHEDDRLAALHGQVTHHGIGDRDDGLGSFGGARQGN